ncbi:hypothetical protein AWB64_01268 [Caballeronia sordidicola]|uniref:Uncharacterized protein n=1 Tax=Caballeronia sordidicola TaxID=196367 RepID=A0A158FHR1_CABSO|nr:hypothetical protein [Caballeronia sordidicola]SAL18600.1 hypothetical protein AWB64_01268 [Caballeronia sordidicola]
MHHQSRLRFPTVAVFTLLLTTSSPGFGETGYSHSGQVLDGASGAPVDAAVTAWAELVETKPGETTCPIFGNKPLQSVTTSKNGDFKLSIPHTEATFTNTYCASNYVPRVDTRLMNTTQNSRIHPTPVEIFPRGTTGEAYQAEVIGKLNDLAYLRQVNPEEFKRVIAMQVKKDQLDENLFKISDILDIWTKPKPLSPRK